MKRPPFVLGFSAILFALTFCALSLAGPAFAQDGPPNVILIMTDDQGYGDFGFTGNKVIRTPHIDKLATESARLTNFYVSPVCSPTRACLMTGRYHQRTRVVDTFRGRSMMDSAEITLAEILHKKGYATGIFGKWHLGDNFPLRPQDQGFDEVLVHRGGGLAQESEPVDNNRRYTDPILFRNGEQVQAKGYCTDIYFTLAMEWIDRQVLDGKPFFAYIPTNAPHGPYHDPPKKLYEDYLKDPAALESLSINPLSDKPDRDGLTPVQVLASIAAMITNVDDNVGRLIAKLTELEAKNNTIIIVMTDNGPNTMRYVGPFRGMKSNVLEGGVRTAFLFHWPARISAGTESDRVAAHIDVLPTLAAATGAHVPRDRKIDGRNFLPLLTGEADSASWPDRTLVLQAHRGDAPIRYHNFMIRSGDWKLTNPSGFQDQPKGEPDFQLYSLAIDPGEANNLAAKHPDKVTELKAAYDAWFDDVGSTRDDNYEAPRIHLGVPTENPTVLTRQEMRATAGEQGAWMVHVPDETAFTVRLLSPAPLKDATVIVRSGETLLAEGNADDMLTGVQLERGDHALEILVTTKDGKTAPAYQVELEH